MDLNRIIKKVIESDGRFVLTETWKNLKSFGIIAGGKSKYDDYLLQYAIKRIRKMSPHRYPDVSMSVGTNNRINLKLTLFVQNGDTVTKKLLADYDVDPSRVEKEPYVYREILNAILDSLCQLALTNYTA